MTASVQRMIETLEQLISIPSPSGNTKEVINFCRNLLELKGIKTTLTNKGSLLATVKGENEESHRFITAHVDTLGAMVKEIKPDGRLKISLIGGFEFNSVEGEYCTVHTEDGTTYSGTILLRQASVHIHKDTGKLERNEETMEVRLDVSASSGKEVEKLGIDVGNFVSFEPRFRRTEEGFIKSRHLDDKASVAVLIEVLETIADKTDTLPYTTHFLLSNNEEIGFGGNAPIPEQTEEYIAVDMGAVGEGQQSAERAVSICAKDSSGPYHKGLRNQLKKLADKRNINARVDIYPYYSSDASAAVAAGVDVRHGLIGPGIDASHSFERTHADSLINTYLLLMAYVEAPFCE